MDKQAGRPVIPDKMGSAFNSLPPKTAARAAAGQHSNVFVTRTIVKVRPVPHHPQISRQARDTGRSTHKKHLCPLPPQTFAFSPASRRDRNFVVTETMFSS